MRHALHSTLVTLAVAGCTGPAATVPDLADPDAQVAASPFATQRHQVPRRQPVDLLIVVDDSASMGEEAGTLARSVLALDDDLFEADLRAAVITTDMVDPARVGRLQTTHRADRTTDAVPGACPDRFDPVLIRQHAAHCEGDPACVADALRARLACMVQQGDLGDAFPQGLAALEAATSCEGPNAALFAACCVGGRYDPRCEAKVDFLRPEATLAVVIVSDKDDCSMDPADPLPRVTPSECAWEAGRLQPTARLWDHLRSLKADPAGQLLVMPVVGMPMHPPEDQLRFRPPTPEDAGCVDDEGNFDPWVERSGPDDEPWADAQARCCPEGLCPGHPWTSCESSSNGRAWAAPRYRALSTEPYEAGSPSVCVEGGWLHALRQKIPVQFLAAWCLEQPPACRQGVDFASDDPGRPCTAAEAADRWSPAVEVTVNGQVLATSDRSVTPAEGCPSGYLVRLAEGATPDEATLQIRYVAAE